MSTPPSPLASVIVPAYNAASTIAACLCALRQQDVASDLFEVIVVDDGSTDGTSDVARAFGARVIVQQNAGPAAARNRGAADALGELLLFTDADCAPTPSWVRELTSPFEDSSVAGAKGAYLSSQPGVVPRLTQIEYEERYQRMLGLQTIDFIDTYSAAYRRDIFLANGGFDTIFPTASVEDQEFSFRLSAKGYRLLFVPHAQVFHHHNGTLQAYIRRKYLIGYWKALLARWHPGRMVSDSHTPQSLKLQMTIAVTLLAATALWAPVALWLSPAPWLFPSILGLIITLFLLSSAPFLRRVGRTDAALLPASIALLWLRALSLSAGFTAGLLRHRPSVGLRQTITWWQRVVKRSFDLLISTLGLCLSAAPMIIIAALVRLTSPGPVIFRQTRVGQDGRTFTIFKFRSMVADAEAQLPSLIDLESLSSPSFKLRGDPRITSVGRVLRRYSLDELPQLWNVFRGEMSLVGPRPEEVKLVDLYSDDQRRRLAVKPGVTGPMQVEGRGNLSFDERLALEVEYIDHYSLRRDFVILWKTLPAVISGDGAY